MSNSNVDFPASISFEHSLQQWQCYCDSISKFIFSIFDCCKAQGHLDCKDVRITGTFGLQQSTISQYIAFLGITNRAQLLCYIKKAA